jgi:glycosyltransferase involved in cell wall biosynthesis
LSESLLSFIVPVYKPDIILFDKVLKALCVQSLKNWEVVFVLDGPCSEARACISKAFKKVANHHKVVEIEHGGPQKARNAGFPHSKGNYVVWWDADCVIEPHAALAWVEWLDGHPEHGFVYSGYKWLEEGRPGWPAAPFDPWTLRVANYISTCFPMRRELFPGWDESLESLQDWDLWLSIVEKGAVGKFLRGFAFATAYPTPKSISGKASDPKVFLERIDRVKAKHSIPIREVCVTSLHNELDGLALAKAIDADYSEYPTGKPSHYKTVIQIGFSLKPGEVDRCATAWAKEHKKILFWTAEDVEVVYRGLSLANLEDFNKRLNVVATQYVEDLRAKEIMTKAGFAVEVLPLPVISKEEVSPLPTEPKFLVDVSPDYGHVFNAIQHSIPDIKLEMASGAQSVDSYTGMISFHRDRLLRQSIKRMLAAGRHVISNVQSPFTGFTDDRTTDAQFIKSFVNKIRATVKRPQSIPAVRYYIDPRRIEKVAEVIK